MKLAMLTAHVPSMNVNLNVDVHYTEHAPLEFEFHIHCTSGTKRWVIGRQLLLDGIRDSSGVVGVGDVRFETRWVSHGPVTLMHLESDTGRQTLAFPRGELAGVVALSHKSVAMRTDGELSDDEHERIDEALDVFLGMVCGEAS